MLALFIFFLSQAHAIEGQFTFQGQTQVLNTIRYETVYTPSEQGKIRLQELMGEGYTCQPKLQFFQCSLFLENQPLPSVTFKPAVVNVKFGKLKSLASVFSGNDFVQSEAEQEVSVNGIKYTKAMYYESKDLLKITVGVAGQSDYFSFVIYADSVSYVEELTQTESKWIFKRYLVESKLSRI